MFKKLFLLILFLVITTPVQAVVSWPPEVKPEQVTAITQIQESKLQGAKWQSIITFWNVGQVDDDPSYHEAKLISKCIAFPNGKCPSDVSSTGTFSGGPNGTFSFKEAKFSLINGTKAILVGIVYTVENPEAFSKYRWSMDESVPDLKIKKGKYEVETVSSARFGDLFGQVEVNIPRPDGTYDEEEWNYAKLDMDLPQGSRIIVREKSGLILVFPDTQTNITVGPGTEIILVSPDPQKSKISLPWGILKANVQKMMKDGSMEIEMSQAVAGIKGTQFILHETKTESSVKVIEGTVKFTSKITGKSVDVSKGESISATSKGFGQKTTFNPSVEEKKWQEFTAKDKKNIFTLFIDWVKSFFINFKF